MRIASFWRGSIARWRFTVPWSSAARSASTSIRIFIGPCMRASSRIDGSSADTRATSRFSGSKSTASVIFCGRDHARSSSFTFREPRNLCSKACSTPERTSPPHKVGTNSRSTNRDPSAKAPQPRTVLNARPKQPRRLAGAAWGAAGAGVELGPGSFTAEA
jgi:hypothetical protein